MPNISTDSLTTTVVSAFLNHSVRTTSKKIVIVEGPTDVKWLKSICDDDKYNILPQAGKDRVLEYASKYDNDAHACFIIDLDLDFFKNACNHSNPKIVYNCMPIGDTLNSLHHTHYNDIEIFQINSRTFASTLLDVNHYLTSTQINKIRQKLETVSNIYGRFYVAYELLDTSTHKQSFIDNVDPISTRYFDSTSLSYDLNKFEDVVDKWISNTHRNKHVFARQVIAKAHSLRDDYPQPWIFSRGHTTVKMFTAYMMSNYPENFSADLEIAMDDISRFLNKVAAAEMRKLPLSKHIQLQE